MVAHEDQVHVETVLPLTVPRHALQRQNPSRAFDYGRRLLNADEV